MYELKVIGKVLTSKSVGTGISSCEKNVPGHGLTKFEKHWPSVISFQASVIVVEINRLPHPEIVAQLLTIFPVPCGN